MSRGSLCAGQPYDPRYSPPLSLPVILLILHSHNCDTTTCNTHSHLLPLVPCKADTPALLRPTPAAVVKADTAAVPVDAPALPAATVHSGTATVRTALLPTSAANLKDER
jgi:hypothetical protein